MKAENDTPKGGQEKSTIDLSVAPVSDEISENNSNDDLGDDINPESNVSDPQHKNTKEVPDADTDLSDDYNDVLVQPASYRDED